MTSSPPPQYGVWTTVRYIGAGGCGVRGPVTTAIANVVAFIILLSGLSLLPPESRWPGIVWSLTAPRFQFFKIYNLLYHTLNNLSSVFTLKYLTNFLTFAAEY